VRVLLPHSHKHDWLSSSVHHVQSSSNFLINCVKLSQNDTINRPWVLRTNSVVDQTLVELCKLVDGIVAYKSLTYKKYDVWLINVNKFGKLSHKFFVALHPSCSVDKHYIKFLVASFSKSFFCNNRRIITISSFIQGYV
jgi:hypothetical protein